jgi:hypothetical protein
VHGHRRGDARAEGVSTAVQEVNLYQPVSKGVRGALSASSTLTILMLVSATLSGLWGFAYWQVGRLDMAAQLVRNQQQAQAALTAAQGPQLAGLSDEQLDAFLVRLGEEVDSKTRALAMLTSESQQQGFSARLRAFGARHIDGIWLDRLTLGSTVESVSLSGSTLSPDVVPRYLRSLASDPALKGGQIDEFVIEKSPGRLMFRAGPRSKS